MDSDKRARIDFHLGLAADALRLPKPNIDALLVSGKGNGIVTDASERYIFHGGNGPQPLDTLHLAAMDQPGTCVYAYSATPNIRGIARELIGHVQHNLMRGEYRLYPEDQVLIAQYAAYSPDAFPLRLSASENPNSLRDISYPTRDTLVVECIGRAVDLAYSIRDHALKEMDGYKELEASVLLSRKIHNTEGGNAKIDPDGENAKHFLRAGVKEGTQACTAILARLPEIVPADENLVEFARREGLRFVQMLATGHIDAVFGLLRRLQVDTNQFFFKPLREGILAVREHDGRRQLAFDSHYLMPDEKHIANHLNTPYIGGRPNVMCPALGIMIGPMYNCILDQLIKHNVFGYGKAPGINAKT